jgi:peptide/nickel transport system permease protein
MLIFLVRRFFLLIVTMLVVSVAVFLITEASPGNVARNILGAYVTPEQEASFLEQNGLNKPVWERYYYWLFGSAGRAQRISGLDLKRLKTEEGFVEWWAEVDGQLIRWTLEGEDLVALIRQPDGTTQKKKDNQRWLKAADGTVYFWGLDTSNHLVRWEKGTGRKFWTYIDAIGWKESSGGAAEYLPLLKGILRGDPGESLLSGRPVARALTVRLRNSVFLAGVSFAIIMPLALTLGVLAGLREGSATDRILSIGGMIFAVIPEFVTGIFSILIFSFWLDLVPGATVYGNKPPWHRLDMLVLPVITLALIDLGYVLRITRASMIEVMRSPYIRTAYLKGLTYGNIIWVHALRNALIAPITVILLHVNWLLSGVVIVEVVFGYPGLGKYLYEAALGKDINALEAGAMVMVAVAVGTQLVADIIYTLLNPRIRYK